MNEAFRQVAATARIKVGPLTHQQRVTRLYRHSLKSLLSWCIDRDVFYGEADKLRQRFEAVKSVDAGKFAVQQGEKELFDCMHPDPYVVPYMPGGTKFMRNPTPAVIIAYPDGDAPEDAYTGTNTPVWPDMVPITFRPTLEGGLVDFAKKKME